MKSTSIEYGARIIAIAIKDEYDASVQIKKINTGSYIYTINAIYGAIYGLRFEVDKTKRNGQKVGNTLNITRYSIYGIEYDNTIIGSIPDSLSKTIVQFLRVLNEIRTI